MLPVVANVNPYALQTPIVNTVTPGTTLVHVPYDNVAPSVSSATIDTNARGNSNALVVASEAAPEATPPTPFSNVLQNSQGPQNIGAQATFLAQLIGQDSSPETTGILIQYEKLAVMANVKYKPSYAFKPPPEPAGVFGRILQSEKVEARPEPQAQQAAAPTQAATANASNNAPVAAVQPRPALQKSTRSAGDIAKAANVQTTAARTATPHIISAYAASAARVDTHKHENVKESA